MWVEAASGQWINGDEVVQVRLEPWHQVAHLFIFDGTGMHMVGAVANPAGYSRAVKLSKDWLRMVPQENRMAAPEEVQIYVNLARCTRIEAHRTAEGLDGAQFIMGVNTVIGAIVGPSVANLRQWLIQSER